VASNPFDQFDSTPSLGQRPVYQEGPPIPTPQTPEQKSNTLTNIEQGRTGIASQQQDMQFKPATTAAGLYDKFTADPAVKAYREVIPQVAQAMGSGPGGANDISVVYAWAKAMDPTGSVRDQDVKLGQSATSPLQQAQFLVSQYHLQEGGQLPPEVKLSLTEAMRDKARMLNRQYTEVRANYLKQAQASGIPTDIFGPHEGELYRVTEENYIKAHGGTPKINGVPEVNGVPVGSEATSTAPKTGEFGGEQDPRLTELNPPQRAAYDAWWKANPNPTPDQLQQFGSTIGLNIPAQNAKDIIAAKKAGRGLSSDIQAIPDISDVRGQGGAAETADAAIRGFVDVPTFGLSDKAAALGDTITNPGSTFQSNLARQYAISDYDAQNHPIARGVGQLGGAFAVPMGEINSLGQLSLKGAAVGAGYGAGSSRSLSDVPQNVLLNAAVGATAPVALSLVGRGGKAAVNALRGGPREVPPLVDPMTGELNQPMDAMNPAQRMQVMQDFGLNTITPGMAGGRSGRIIEQVLNNLPASAGHMEDVTSAASKELRGAMQGVAQKFGSSKTLNEGGTALQAGAMARNERAPTVIGKAYDAIPISPETDTTKANTVGLLQQLVGRFQSNPGLAEAMHDPQLAKYLDAFQGGKVSWQDMKDFRSLIGEKIGVMRFGEKSSISDLRALYGALSQDMRDTAAAQGPKALHAFERANNLNRQNEEVVQGALTRILGRDGSMTPEDAAAAIHTMTQGGKRGGDLKTLAQIKSATNKTGAWDEIASTLIHLGGQPAKSEGRAFQPDTFVRWYSDMSEGARALLFKPELRKSLDQFVAVNQQLSRVRGLNNSSNTGPLVLAGAQLLQAGRMIMSGDLAGLGIQAGANALNFGFAKLWTTPKFVQWATGYSRAAASGNANAVRSQVGRLSKLAATDPELRAPIESLLKNIANDNAVPSIAASSNANPDQNQQ
jgi:hypothetical protein